MTTKLNEAREWMRDELIASGSNYPDDPVMRRDQLVGACASHFSHPEWLTTPSHWIWRTSTIAIKDYEANG
jgi:hypothetical protein